MRRTRRTVGRGRLSLRSRLLAGLITITALFLIVMGVVTTVVLGHTEQDQFNTERAAHGQGHAEEYGEPGRADTPRLTWPGGAGDDAVRRRQATWPICRNGWPT